MYIYIFIYIYIHIHMCIPTHTYMVAHAHAHRGSGGSSASTSVLVGASPPRIGAQLGIEEVRQAQPHTVTNSRRTSAHGYEQKHGIEPNRHTH